MCAALLCLGLLCHQDRLTWSVSLISLLLPLTVSWCAAKEKSIITPFVLFSGGYGAYHGLLLLRLAFLNLDDYPYPIELTNEVVLKSSLLSALGAVSIALVWLSRRDRSPLSRFRMQAKSEPSVYSAGILLLVISLMSFVFQIHEMGGLVTSATTDRVERFQSYQGVHLPYLSFAAVSVALLFLASEGRRNKRRFAWISLAVWASLLIIEGERIPVLRISLAVATILGTLQPRLLRLRGATLMAGISIAFGGLLFGGIRVQIPSYLQGSMSPAAFFDAANIDWLLGLVMPDKSEFGGSYFSILDAVSTRREMLLGSSYIESPMALLPEGIYPGRKPEDLADALSEAASSGAAYVMGWSYNPVAEAYRNFGTFGVPIVVAGLSIFFLWVGTKQSQSLFSLLFSSVFMLESFTVHRGDFRWFCQVVASSAVASYLAICSIKLIEATKRSSLRRTDGPM